MAIKLQAGHLPIEQISFQPLMTALGLYHDDHDLVASDLGLDHLWDVSRFCQDSRLGCNVTSHHIRISSFSSNVALVVFECQEGKRVAMYHQVEKYNHPRILSVLSAETTDTYKD